MVVPKKVTANVIELEPETVLIKRLIADETKVLIFRRTDSTFNLYSLYQIES